MTLLFYASCIARMTGMYHHAQLFSVEMEVFEFILSWVGLET
jgi:hypothetical protein